MLDNKTRWMLDVIDTFLAEGDSASRDLWDVLTALRGPDDPNPYGSDYAGLGRKVRTTRVRAAAFPKVAEKAMATQEGRVFHGAYFEIEADVKHVNNWHCQLHLDKAEAVLGLKLYDSTGTELL
jgi:hypothetical protein